MPEESIHESAWEACEGMLCEAPIDSLDACAAPSKWRLRAAFEGGVLRDEYWSFSGTDLWLTTNRWVCDEHKVEPQPPAYSEWLAAVRS